MIVYVTGGKLEGNSNKFFSVIGQKQFDRFYLRSARAIKNKLSQLHNKDDFDSKLANIFHSTDLFLET